MRILHYPDYLKYKESNIDWIGEIPHSWGLRRLASFGRFLKGGGFSKSDLQDEGERAVLYGDIYTKYNFQIVDAVRFISSDTSKNSIKLEKGDLLFTGSGETVEDIGKCVVFIGEKDTYVGGDVIVFKQNMIESSYLKYVLNSDGVKQEKAKAAKGEIIVHTYASNLKDIYIPIPPIKEQTAITNFLDEKCGKIDMAIEQKERIVELLKERKRTVTQNAVTKGIDPNAKMKNSSVEWIGEIPDNWEVKRIKYLFNLIMDVSENNNDHELLSIYTDIGVKPRKELEERGNKASTTDGYWLVKKGDFIVNKLLAWMGAIGLSEYEGVTSPAYDILRPFRDVNGPYYHYLFRTRRCSEELKKYSRGIMEMRLRLYFDKFGGIYFPLPPYEDQIAIITHINKETAKIDEAIEVQQKQVEKLMEYKVTLINSAVTGKIKVI